MDIVRLVLGHLTGIECRRALARGWLLLVRGLLGGLLAALLLFLLWTWWLGVQFDRSYVPALELKIVFSAVALVLLTIVVVEAPAVLAGSLAGERERGILHLLLTTEVSPREIVEGRLFGKLSQVGMILLAGIPTLAFLGPFAGMGLQDLATIALLIAAAGIGSGGLAIGASVVSRRGRDALFAVYILMILLLASPLCYYLGVPAEATEVLLRFNPYASMNRLVWGMARGAALETSALWLTMGIAGAGLATWRLRPSCEASGATVKSANRGKSVPPVSERPMLWKELYVERAGTLGRFGRWLGLAITLTIGGGSLVLAAVVMWERRFGESGASDIWAINLLGLVLGGWAGMFLGCLLQLGVALRAAVSIASERERGTWDALLMSPLTPGEIGLGKLLGSLYGLRYMAAAMALAWTVGVIFHAVSVHDYVVWMAGTTIACAFMAAIGVRLSLALSTATRSMTWTIGCWLGGHTFVAFCAFSIIAIVMTASLALWALALQYQLIPPNAPPWFPMRWANAWPLTVDLVTLAITVLIVIDTSLRFDRIAGRAAGGALAVAVDAFVYGDPREFVISSEPAPPPADPGPAPPRELPQPAMAADAVAAE